MRDADAPRIKRPKTGGRRKGTPNKNNAGRYYALQRLKLSGEDPIKFFADVLRDVTLPYADRFAAAKELAPYMHPKLTAIEGRGGATTHEERLRKLQAMLANKPDPGGEGKTQNLGEGADGAHPTQALMPPSSYSEH